MKLIVGLGNPGVKYEKTRHNLGFMIAEQFLKDFEPVDKTIWQNESKFKSEIAQLEWQPKHGNLEKVILAKPKTYMNNSGMAVQLMAVFYKIQPSDIWVMHDDIDLPLGNMKIRLGGAAGGHHGVESVINSLSTDKFWRFRMGIGISKSNIIHSIGLRLRGSDSRNSGQISKLKNVEDYVLGEFGGGEKGKLKELIKKGAKAIETALEESLEVAMNRYNVR